MAAAASASSASASASAAVGKNGYSFDAANLGKKANSYLTDSKYFKKCCNDAFKDVDLDGSNSLTFAEVYCAILLLYTKLLYVSAASLLLNIELT